jgi:hypothetical protein
MTSTAAPRTDPRALTRPFVPPEILTAAHERSAARVARRRPLIGSAV